MHRMGRMGNPRSLIALPGSDELQLVAQQT
jgi:hypothetical protein